MRLPTRLKALVSYNRPAVVSSLRWIGNSREFTNFTYDLTSLNLDHLAWFVAEVTGVGKDAAEGFLSEVQLDRHLRDHIRRATESTALRWVSDTDAHYGRRVGWYAIVRAMKPTRAVETGIEKGLGSLVIAAALLRNAEEGSSGRLLALDIDPNAGLLLGAPYADVIDIVVGDSLVALRALDEKVDFFIHDSDHSEKHERAELDAIESKLSDRAVVLSDNAHVTGCLSQFATDMGRRFLFFGEVPLDHWYPGGGIGCCYK